MNAVTATATRSALALITTAGLLGLPASAGAQWRHARSDSGNSSFARVDTDAAIAPRLSREIGPIGPGVNPVIGPDGTVYIGNLFGELHAFHPEGEYRWVRQLDAHHGGILASPVVGADGSVYVISTRHLDGTRRNESFLHKFTPGGGWIFQVPFPAATNYPQTDGGATNAAPSIWQWNGAEAIIVPVAYTGSSADVVDVLAFSTGGGLLGRAQVGITVEHEITGGADLDDIFPECLVDFLPAGPIGVSACAVIGLMSLGHFQAPMSYLPLAGAGWPLPGVAILPNPAGGPPTVIATNGRRIRVRFAFTPETGFSEIARSTSTRHTFTATPVADGPGRARFATAEGRLANDLSDAASTGLGLNVTAAPTRLNDGRFVVLGRDGQMTVTGGAGWPTVRRRLESPTIASAAASCTHIFVSTKDGLFTFNTSMGHVATSLIPGGGLSAPVIGPQGNVYVVGQNGLYTFAGPSTGGVVVRTACDTLAPPR